MRRFIWAFEWVRGTWRDPRQHFQARRIRSCPCCGFRGYFVSAKRRGPREFRCPACASRPRDRQIGLIAQRLNLPLEGRDILHFAPEWWLFRRLRTQPGYVGGDIQRRLNANAHVDITQIDFADASFDLLICNHVLEHVQEDRQAMGECHRVLRDHGVAIFTVPVQLDRSQTWEPPADMPRREVERICGWDHKRTYGMDFADRLRAAGFDVRIVTFGPGDREEHRLIDEPVFLATKRQGTLEADVVQRLELESV